MATRSITIALEAKVSGLVAGFKTAQQAAADFGSKTEEFAQRNRESLEAVGKTGVAAGGLLVAGLGAAGKAAMDWESAWTGVLKTVDGTPAQLARVEDGLRGLAKELPASHAEIAAVAEAAGQLGIETDGVVEFTRTMINMGESTNLSAEQAATSLARFMNIMGTSQGDVDRLGSTLVGLGNNFATTESEIMDMTMRLAGASNQIGLTEGQTMGLAAAMSSVGIEAEAGGSAMSLTMKRIGASVDNSDAKLGLFAKTAGMTATQFQEAWQKDAAGALESFVVGLGRAGEQGESVNGILSELGITGIRESDALLRLSSAGELMGDSMKQGAAEYESGMALIEEANKRYETAESKVRIAWNNITDAAIDAGAVLLPIIASVANGVADMASAFSALPAPVQSAVTVLGGLAGVGLLAAGGIAMLAPRVFETIGHFRNLKTEASGAYTALGKVGKAAGVASLAFMGLQIIGSVGNNLGAGAKSADEMAQALLRAAKEGRGLDEVINNGMFENANNFLTLSGDIDSVGEALARVQSRNFGDTVNDWFKSVSGYKSEIHEVEDSITSMDAAIASFATSGSLDQAARSFQMVAESAKAQGVEVKETAESFPEYMDALRNMATSAGVALTEQELLNWAMGETPPAMIAAASSSEETAAALGDMGGEAEATAASLEDIVAALFALGEINMSSRDSTAAFHESLRAMNDIIAEVEAGTLDLGEVLNDTGTDFDLTTEAGARVNAALQDISRKGMADVEAKAREGMGQPELQANLKTTYDSLITALAGMDITGAGAETLARKVLGVPDNVDIDTWMSDAAQRMAESTGQALNGIPRNINVSVNVATAGVAAALGGIASVAAAAAAASGAAAGVGGPESWGRVPGRATGGAIYGPGTGTSDTAGIFALSNGEHVFTAAEVQKMGGQSAVYQFRNQLKAGVAGYAGGGRVGREYSAPVSYTSSSAAAGPVIDYERLAAAIESRPVIASVRIGNRDVAQANIQGRKELRLSN